MSDPTDIMGILDRRHHEYVSADKEMADSLRCLLPVGTPVRWRTGREAEGSGHVTGHQACHVVRVRRASTGAEHPIHWSRLTWIGAV